MGWASPIWGVVELGRVWYHVKVLHITHNLFAGTDTLSLSVYEPIAMRVIFFLGSPPFGEGIKLGGRVWHQVKVLHITHNLFVGTDILPFSIVNGERCTP